MKYFEFYSPVKICSGENAICNIKHELDYFGASKPLVLSDAGLEKVGTLKNVLKILSKNKVDVSRVFYEIPTDSSTLTINEIVKLYNSLNADSIIALGGGSVIDTAKGVKLVLSQLQDNILSLEGNEILPKGKAVPFIVIPTTCGTGSECTSVAVIKNNETHVKMEYISPALLPDVAVLDPAVISTLPPKLVATTSLDALTHAIEAYSCLQRNTVSSGFAVSAIKLISDNLFMALNNPKKDEYKLNLLNASTLAGMAFSNSMVGIVHAIGHALGAYRVPHGNAMAILLPHCLNFNKDVLADVYAEMLLTFKGPEFYVKTPDQNKADVFISEVKNFVELASKISGFSLKLSDYGIAEIDLDKIADIAINDGAAAINPKLFTRKNIVEILKECM